MRASAWSCAATRSWAAWKSATDGHAAVSWLTRARRGALLYLLAWLIVGAVLGGVCAVMAPAPPVNALLFAIPGTLVYGVAAGFSAYYLCRANPLGARPPAL